MKNTKELYRSFNFSGADVDTSKIYRDVETNIKNMSYLNELVNDLKLEGILLETVNKRYNISNIFIINTIC